MYLATTIGSPRSKRSHCGKLKASQYWSRAFPQAAPGGPLLAMLPLQATGRGYISVVCVRHAQIRPAQMTVAPVMSTTVATDHTRSEGSSCSVVLCTNGSFFAK